MDEMIMKSKTPLIFKFYRNFIKVVNRLNGEK